LVVSHSNLSSKQIDNFGFILGNVFVYTYSLSDIFLS